MATSWKAIYNDGTALRQFELDGSENTFKDIDEDKLFEFRLFHNEKVLSLFPKTGTFGINGFLHNTDVSYISDEKYRLIYFVRRKKVLGAGGNTNKHFIGFQITKDNRNYKRVISVEENEIQFEFEERSIQ